MRIFTAKAKDQFSEVVNRAADGEERIILTRKGKEIAAVVSMKDVALLEEIEDLMDVEDARAAEKEAARKGEKPIPLAKVIKMLGW